MRIKYRESREECEKRIKCRESREGVRVEKEIVKRE